MTDTAARLGAGRFLDPSDAVQVPDLVTTTVHELTTVDEAKVTGVLRVPRGAKTVVTFMHPRQDLSHHALVPHLLSDGYAVWTQGSRSPNNDLNLIHEQTLLDFAAGQVYLRDRGFSAVVTLGHSGGGTLAAFYCQQAGTPADGRLACAPLARPARSSRRRTA